jgi:hypothetical protein
VELTLWHTRHAHVRGRCRLRNATRARCAGESIGASPPLKEEDEPVHSDEHAEERSEKRPSEKRGGRWRRCTFGTVEGDAVSSGCESFTTAVNAFTNTSPSP